MDFRYYYFDYENQTWNLKDLEESLIRAGDEKYMFWDCDCPHCDSTHYMDSYTGDVFDAPPEDFSDENSIRVDSHVDPPFEECEFGKPKNEPQ